MRIGKNYLAVFLISITPSKAFLRHSSNLSRNNQGIIQQPTRNRNINKFTTSATTATTTASATNSDSIKIINKMNRNIHNFTWQQTMLRIKDPKQSVPFYEDNFGFKLIHFYNFPQWNFSLYFMAFLKDDDKFDLTPGY